MKEHDVYPSQWLSATDIPEGGLVVTVRGVSLAEVGRDKDSKPVLSFEELDKGLILNKTNWRNMVLLTGEADSDNWPGATVELYATRVQFGGDEVDAVRIRKPKSKPAGTAPAKPTISNGETEKWVAFVSSLTPEQRKAVAEALGGLTPRAWLTESKATVDQLIEHVRRELNLIAPLDDLGGL